jgi:hypothetical protein
MKIDHVSLTIFTWDNIPRTSYHVGSFTQPLSNLGLLRIRTDTGHEGHAFLGTASNPASMDGPQLIRWIKPLLMGANPLERERLHGRMLKLSRNVSYRCIGAADVRLAAVLIVGELAVAHQVQCPHWAVIFKPKPGLDVFGVGGAVTRCVHEFAL